MVRVLFAAAVAALVLAPVAVSASSPVQVLRPDGKVLASAQDRAFDYPANGAIVHVGRASVKRSGVLLRDISLLRGRIQAVRMFVPRHGRAVRVAGLYVNGRAVESRINRLIPLSRTDYLITSQAAVAGGRGVGLVGLRLSLGAADYNLPAGSQILVGLPVDARPTKLAATHGASPLAVLGFTGGTASFARPSPVPFFTSGPMGRQAVTLAARYLGVPYLWGGASPATGFDCSGLVMYVYAQLGIRLTHYTGSQIHEGMPVARSHLQPGDIVFFFPNSEGVPGHEGLYIGHGRFIQAPHTGDMVKISSLSDPHYGLGYVGAVRPFSGA